MKISRRLAVVLFLLWFLILPALLFPSFIQDNLITPVALVLLLFWRILQSIDQAIYWLVLVLLALGYFFFRLSHWAQGPVVPESASSDSNATLERISYWQTAIRAGGIETNKSSTLVHDLGMLLAAEYASRRPESVRFEIYDDLKRRQIPLPGPIHAFLFPVESSGSRRSLKQILRNLRDLPRKRIRRWTGRETAEYYQSLEQVLTFMESELEIKHDDEHLDHAHH